MTKKIPRRPEQMPFVIKGTLFKPDSSPICEVAGRTAFFDWLRHPDHRGFRYESLAGVEISVLKERRKGRSGEYFDYWYAHRHIFGRLLRVYLGKAEKVTFLTLEQAAGRLAQLELKMGDGRVGKKGRSVVRRDEGIISETNSQGHVNENAPSPEIGQARGELRQEQLV